MMSCFNNLFQESDFKNKINSKNIKNHCSEDNAWIIINRKIYSLKNNDKYLLFLFKDYYGKDVTSYLKNNYNDKEIIKILDKLKIRKIGIIE